MLWARRSRPLRREGRRRRAATRRSGKDSVDWLAIILLLGEDGRSRVIYATRGRAARRPGRPQLSRRASGQPAFAVSGNPHAAKGRLASYNGAKTSSVVIAIEIGRAHV